MSSRLRRHRFQLHSRCQARWPLVGLLVASLATPLVSTGRAQSESESAPAGELVAAEVRPTGISGYDGVLAWSSYSRSAGGYRLKFKRGERTWFARVRPRRVPFDVDLGPGPNGATVAVYSRCHSEGRSVDPMPIGVPTYAAGRRCDVFRYDIERRRERQVKGAASRRWVEVMPTIWRDRIVFVRRPERRGAYDTPMALLYELREGARPRLLPLATLPRVGGRFGVQFGPGPTGLDLRATRLAFTWSVEVGRCAPDDPDDPPYSVIISELWIDDLAGGRRLVEKTCAGDAATQFLSPAWADRRLLYGVDVNTGERQRQRVRRYDPDADTHEASPEPFEFAALASGPAGAIDYARILLLRGPNRGEIWRAPVTYEPAAPYPTRAEWGYPIGYRDSR